uniref:triadin-like n=1 Tax=Erigeron canadensis TaxID=72917 RepID=UPI001CB8ECB4|nr:triadin-like [Erigeron canadensis]
MQPAAAAMNRFKETLIQFAHSNPNLFPQNSTTDYPTLINQQFSEFFTDFHTPNHPPYAAMINRAIQELNETGGSSEESISKYIQEEYVDLPWAHSALLKHHLEKLCDLKEICMTRKKRYLLVDADSDLVSATTPEKQLQTLETGKKSSQSGKKQKNRQDLKLGKTSSGNDKKGKKQKSRLDSESAKISSNKHHEKNKKKGKLKHITEVCQKEDQAIQVLDEVADEQEKHDVCIDQEMEEDGVCANATEQNETEKMLLIKHSDVTGSEDQSVDLSNDKEQIGTCGTKKRKNKKQKQQIMPTRSSKRSNKNEETQLLVLSEANLKLDKEITDAASQEQKQIIEVMTSDTQIQEENKDVEVCQKEDQAIQALDEVADEQEKHDVCIDQELGDGGVCANTTEQNQTEKILLIKHSDVTGSEDQSVELSNDKEKIGTKKRKNKKQKIMPTRSSKRSKKNKETQLLVLSEANLKLDKEITDAASQEQKRMIEVKTSDTQVQEENKDVEMALEVHSDNSGCKYMSDQTSIGVQTSDTQIQEENKDVEIALELHSDNIGCINSKDIHMEQSPPILELEESPNSNHMLQQEGKKNWTRSLLKSVLKRDVVAGLELTGSPGNANMPKGKLDIVEHLSEEKQLVPSAVSTIMNNQRSKLRSSKKSTVMESLDTEVEPQQKSRSPSLEKPVVELVKPAQVQEAGNTQQDQQPDELKELKPKTKGRGRPPKKSRQAFKKVRVGNRSAKPKRNEDKVTRKYESTNKKDKPKKNALASIRYPVRAARRR